MSSSSFQQRDRSQRTVAEELVRDFWLPWYTDVDVGPRDVALVPLYVETDSALCLKKRMTLRDGDPARYSSRRQSEIWANKLHEKTYLEDG